MRYRTLAGEQVSQLGFGAMRLPTLDGTIDRAQTSRLIRSAIDAGLNYLDTAWVYHGGESETVVGEVLEGGWRNRVFVATKSPVWLIETPADFPRILDEQLKKLRTDHIDFYLLHSLGTESWNKCQRFDALGFLERAKAAGKIRHAGFSFHDEVPVFQTILKSYPWEFCQIQFNYLDRRYQAGLAGLEAAVAQGTGVVVMEPLRGGNLAGPVPPPVQALWDGAPVKRTAAEWALRWIWDHPGVALVLSGMGTQAQVDENLAIAASAAPGDLTDDDKSRVDQAEIAYRNLVRVGCTGCRYCMPCPSGVDIPRNFAHLNEYAMFLEAPAVKAGYQWIPVEARADRCVACGACVDLCPQQIAIPDVLGQVARTFE